MFLDVTLKPRKEEKKEQEVVKPQYDLRFENNINSGKQLIDVDNPQEFKYSQWRTNLSLSNHTDTLSNVQDMNLNYHLPDKLHYHYLFYSVRKINRYGKKKTEQEKKMERELKKEQELIALVQEYYKYNVVRAKEALKLLSKEQLDIIRKKQEKGGSK